MPFKVQYNPKLIKPVTVDRLVKTGLHRVKFGIEAQYYPISPDVLGEEFNIRFVIAPIIPALF